MTTQQAEDTDRRETASRIGERLAELSDETNEILAQAGDMIRAAGIERRENAINDAEARFAAVDAIASEVEALLGKFAADGQARRQWLQDRREAMQQHAADVAAFLADLREDRRARREYVQGLAGETNDMLSDFFDRFSAECDRDAEARRELVQSLASDIATTLSEFREQRLAYGRSRGG
ncbi:MAG: hypothetical protein AAF747_02045 [Planctomycetota bacterium]